MKATKRGKLHLKVKKIGVSEIEHSLWPLKYCEKARANLFSLTCKLLQGAKMSSYSMKDIGLDTSEGQIILDQRIKIRDGWATGVNFIHEDSCEWDHAMNENVSLMTF